MSLIVKTLLIIIYYVTNNFSFTLKLSPFRFTKFVRLSQYTSPWWVSSEKWKKPCRILTRKDQLQNSLVQLQVP